MESNGVEWHRDPPDTKEDDQQDDVRLVPSGFIRFEPCHALIYQSGIVPEYPQNNAKREAVEQNQEDPSTELG